MRVKQVCCERFKSVTAVDFDQGDALRWTGLLFMSSAPMKNAHGLQRDSHKEWFMSFTGV